MANSTVTAGTAGMAAGGAAGGAAGDGEAPWLDPNSVDIGGGTAALGGSCKGSGSSGAALTAQALDEDSQVVAFSSAEFYSSSAGSDAASACLVCASLGLVVLLAHWFPQLQPLVQFWRKMRRDDPRADRVVVCSLDGVVSALEIQAVDSKTGSLCPLRARWRRQLQVGAMLNPNYNEVAQAAASACRVSFQASTPPRLRGGQHWYKGAATLAWWAGGNEGSSVCLA